MYRAAGVDTDIPQLELGTGRPRRVAVESLTGKWSEEISWNPGKPPTSGPDDPPRPSIGYSPVTGASIAQDRLEPVVREHAIKAGADVRLNTTLIAFEQDFDGVAATLRNADGSKYVLRADYMIAADGHASRIRGELGIGRAGHGFMYVVRSVLFRAPEIDHYLESGISQFELDQPGLKGMLTTYGDGRWLLMIVDDEERDEAEQLEMVHRALGRSDIDVELITSGRWVLGANIADTFAKGRVFLVGDAAHALPPARGGYGANTGIEDAFNIAWKLAAVVSGESAPALLDTYDAERRPIAWLRHNQILARPDYAPVATEEEKKVVMVEDDAMELGQLYRSASVIGAGDDLPPALRPEQWAGQPGSRAQHLWVSKSGQRFSTIDLLQRHWTLVTADERWCEAVVQTGERLGIEVEALHIGGEAGSAGTILSPAGDEAAFLSLDLPIEQIVNEPGGKSALDAHIQQLTSHEMYAMFKSMTLHQLQPMSEGLITDAVLAQIEKEISTVPSTAIPTDLDEFRSEFLTAFGIGPSGASLVRPDGYVAWRTTEITDNPVVTLVDILRHVSCSIL
jgi:2-polyprenyl-6-methoxyphenol hydroxylase-like FAD-dependent oxidoreductase